MHPTARQQHRRALISQLLRELNRALHLFEADERLRAAVQTRLPHSERHKLIRNLRLESAV
jgi:hypothetical protein